MKALHNISYFSRKRQIQEGEIRVYYVTHRALKASGFHASAGMAYNNSMQDFVKNYRQFIENVVRQNISPSEKILFDGWIESFFLVIIDHSTHLTFVFNNIRESQRVYNLSYYSNTTDYKCFKYIHIQHFPEDFLKIIKKHGLIYSNKYYFLQETTLQRLIACCRFDINGFHIHHFDENISNNAIDNLIPVNPNFHNTFHIDDSQHVLLKFFNDSKQILKPKQARYSKYQNDEVLYQLCYLRFIEDYKINEFKKLKLNFGLPSIRTLKYIFKDFIDFKAFYHLFSMDSADNCTRSDF